MQNNFLIFLFIAFLLEFYIYQAVKTITQNSFIRLAYWGITIIVYSITLYIMLNLNEKNFSTMASLLVIFIVPKILGALFLLFDDFTRLIKFGVQYFSAGENHYPERRKFLSLLAMGSTALMVGLAIDGSIWGKFRHKVRRIKLKFNNLPKSFKGYKIIQISDVHSGSFEDPKKLQHAIDLINEQNPDLVLFTGDMVNNYADEFKPFIPLFSQIKAKDGKFSVLGNHDYGLY